MAGKRQARACFVVTINSWRVLCDDKWNGIQRATLKDAFEAVGMGAGRWKVRFSSPS